MTFITTKSRGIIGTRRYGLVWHSGRWLLRFGKYGIAGQGSGWVMTTEQRENVPTQP